MAADELIDRNEVQSDALAEKAIAKAKERGFTLKHQVFDGGTKVGFLLREGERRAAWWVRGDSNDTDIAEMLSACERRLAEWAAA